MATTRNTILTQQSPRHCFHLKCPKCVFRQFFGQCFWVSIFSTDKCQTSRISRGRVSLSRRYLLVYNNIDAIGWIHTIMIFPPHLTTHSDAPAMIGWSCQGNLHSLSIAAIMYAGKTDLSTYCQSYSIVGKILKYGNVFVTLCSNIKYEIAHIPHLQLGSSRVLHTFYISVHQLGNWPRHLRRPP